MKQIFTLFFMCISVFASAQTYHSLNTSNLTEDWSTNLLTTNDTWTPYASIRGFRGDGLTTTTNVNPQTVIVSDAPGILDVTVDQNNPNTVTGGGVYEFDGLANPTIAMQGSSTADAPYLKFYLNSTGRQAVNISFNARDIDGSSDNAVQQIAVQYRIGTTGDFTDLPSVYIADASSGPSLATLVTAVSVTLPTDANNVSQLEIRVITTNAAGNDEFIGIDDIVISSVAISGGNSNASNIVAATFTPSTNINYANFQAADIDAMNSVELGQFTIQDGGGMADMDMLSTTLTGLAFNITNGAQLRRIAIYDGTTEIAEIAGGNAVTFSMLSGLVAADDASKTFSIRATFNSTVTDNSQIVATISSASADVMGSGFAAANAGGAATSSMGDDNRIEVTADRLAFVQNVTSPTGSNSAMMPAPTVAANDANGNSDLDFVSAVTITSTGTLSAAQSETAVAGLATFSNLIHSAAGTGLQLTAASGTLTSATSNLFDIGVASATTDYFQSKQTGNWDDLSTWESSPNGMAPWINATLVPTSASEKITIVAGHTVTVNVAANADNLVVDGTLACNTAAPAVLTINDGTTNPDLTINGTLLATATFGSCWSIPTMASVLINSTGKVRVEGGGGNQAFATNTNSTWSNNAAFEWATTNSPSLSGQNYFPTLANTTDVPVFRFVTTPTSNIGGSNTTTINGILDATVDVNFGGSGNKIIRAGIKGNGNVSHISTGKIIIDGNNAILEGTGTISTVGGLEIGGASSMTVTLNNNKTVASGPVTLVSNAKVDLDDYNLTIPNISGGSNMAYLLSNGTGNVTIKNIAATPVTVPLSSNPANYTPVVITNNGTIDDFTFKVSETYSACLTGAQQLNSVQLTFDVSEAVTGGSDVTLSFDYNNATRGATFGSAMAVIAHCSASNTIDYSGGSVSGTVLTLAGVNSFSPFIISSDPTILPTKLKNFVVENNNSTNTLKWAVADQIIGEIYEVEMSTNGTNFVNVGSIAANNQTMYSFYHNSAASITYYRLKIKQITGTDFYSATVKVNNIPKSLYINAVYPNPSKGSKVSVSLTSKYSTNGTLHLIDAQGSIVMIKNLLLQKGSQIINLDLGAISAGVYQLLAVTTAQSSSSRVIVH